MTATRPRQGHPGVPRAERAQRAWEYWFPKLLEFRTRFGHCRVPAAWPEDPALNAWIRQLRTKATQGRLPEDQMEALREIEFTFSVHESNWARRLAELQHFRARFGHCLVPIGWPENPELSTWVTNRRTERECGTMKPERILALDALGFEWKARDATHERRLKEWAHGGRQGPRPLRHSEIERTSRQQRWDKRIAELRSFAAEHAGFTALPTLAPVMAKWVYAYRRKWRRGLLSSAHCRDLGLLGFSPEPSPQAQADKMIARLEAFQRRFGHCDVPLEWPEDPQLGKWVAKTRSRFREGLMREERVARLSALGFEFDPIESEWTLHFEVLREFHRRFGHCRVSRNWPESPSLGQWVQGQRSRARRGAMPAHKKALLDSLGFSWNAMEDTWDESFYYAEQFWKAHGHLRVPIDWPQHPTLCNWVGQQRNLKRMGQLRPDREHRLLAIGMSFEQNQNDHRFEERLAELELFKREHGHCDVPRGHPGGLGVWLGNVRGFIRKGRFAKDRVQRLLALGFTVEAGRRRRTDSSAPWLQALEFRRRHGHFAIPATEPLLAAWAARQRERASRGRLAPVLRRQLELHGFPLTAEDLLWEQRFAALQAFAQRNQNCRVPESTELGRWLETQRRLAHAGELDGEHEERLEEIGALGDGAREAG